MSSFCNKILFFSNKEIVLDELLEKINPYMMTTNNKTVQNCVEEKPTEIPLCTLEMHNSVIEQFPMRLPTPIPTPPPPPQQDPHKFVLPFHPDTIFWCLYIAHYGYDDYLCVERNYGLKELEIKKSIADFLRLHPEKIKNTNYKITKAATQEILSDLLTTQKETNMNCLLAIITFFRINVIITDETNQFIWEFVSEKNETISTYLLKRTDLKKYKIRLEPITEAEITELKNTKICLDNYLKPMKSISSYKMDELESIATKLGNIDTNKKWKKQDLYDLLTQKMAKI
jgi:hypothetical protein